MPDTMRSVQRHSEFAFTGRVEGGAGDPPAPRQAPRPDDIGCPPPRNIVAAKSRENELSARARDLRTIRQKPLCHRHRRRPPPVDACGRLETLFQPFTAWAITLRITVGSARSVMRSISTQALPGASLASRAVVAMARATESSR